MDGITDSLGGHYITAKLIRSDTGYQEQSGGFVIEGTVKWPEDWGKVDVDPYHIEWSFGWYHPGDDIPQSAIKSDFYDDTYIVSFWKISGVSAPIYDAVKALVIACGDHADGIIELEQATGWNGLSDYDFDLDPKELYAFKW
jgi:hypothetical protein